VAYWRPKGTARRVVSTVVAGSLLTAAATIYGTGTAAASTQSAGPPPIAASAFVVADARTGQVLGWRDPHGWYRPASTLKLLTAVSLIPVLNPSAMVRATQRAANVVPNVAGLIPGHSYRVSDLFTAMLTISANDAAVALTQATGSYARGIALMNATARRLGAHDTVAVDPNGLDAPGQHTSAYDLALIARQALRIPAFLRYDETRAFDFRVSAQRSEMLYNQNRLLSEYPGGIGGKIGWTSAAGATYVGLARRHGVTLIVTELHCPALTETVSAERLLNWGFAVDGRIRPVGKLVSASLPVAPAVHANHNDRGAARASGAGRPPGPSSAAPVRTAGSVHAADAAAFIRRGVGGTIAAAAFTAMALLAVVGFLTRTRRRRPATHRRASATRSS
jgi:D-alanyl-D-alanine carboxypeptidase (penicillin-binding protein 5/6)